MSTRRTRTALRWLHLLGAALIGTYVYSPWDDIAWYAMLVEWGVIPLLVVSGLWMWLGHRLKPGPRNTG